MAQGRTKRGRLRSTTASGVLSLVLVASACSVDTSGVIRASDDPSLRPIGDEVILDVGDCGDLLAELQTGAVDLVGPNGFIGVVGGIDNRFGPVFRGRGFIDEFGFGGQVSGGISVGESAVSAGDLLAVAQAGRLYLFAADGSVSGSLWLDALAEQRWPAPETGLLARDGEIVAISPAVTLRDEGGDQYSATVIQRIDIADPSTPVIVERLTVRGEVAGADVADEVVRVAVAVPAPALDFLYASTVGGEDAATEHNQSLLAETSLADWLGGYELEVKGDDGLPTTTTGLLGGCDVISAEGADAALGATVLIEIGDSGGLADLDATTVLGQGRVSYGNGATYVLSPRSHAVGFTEPGRQGSPRVVISRVVTSDAGLDIDSIGIVPGSLSGLPTAAISDDHLMIFTNTFDNFGNGGYEAASLESVDGKIREVDSIRLPVEPWDQLTLHALDDELLISGGQGSALIDASDPTDLSVVGVEARWDQGNFIGPPQLAPYGGGSVLRFDPGPVTRDFGGIDQFVNGLAFGEFGFGWEPWNENQSTASIQIVEGHPIDGEVHASYVVDAFALWPISTDHERGEIVAGVIGLRGDEGDLFDGAVVLQRDGDQLVETERMSLDPPEVSDFGASECEDLDIDGNVLQILGLWNQSALRCDEGVPGGMVGHTCNSLTIPEFSNEELRNWFGFDDPDLQAELAELRTSATSGTSFQSCVARPAGIPSVVKSYLDDDTGRWLVGPAAVHRVDLDGGITSSIAIEPPYTN